jgi:hypothetical protein
MDILIAIATGIVFVQYGKTAAVITVIVGLAIHVAIMELSPLRTVMDTQERASDYKKD